MNGGIFQSGSQDSVHQLSFRYHLHVRVCRGTVLILEVLRHCLVRDSSTARPITVLEPSPFCLCRFLGPATKHGVGQCFHQPVRLFADEEPPVFGVLVSNMDGYNYPSSWVATEGSGHYTHKLTHG